MTVLMMSSSQVFHESMIFSSRNFKFNFLDGFYDKKVISAFLISIENFYLVEKTKQRKFHEKKIVDSYIQES